MSRAVPGLFAFSTLGGFAPAPFPKNPQQEGRQTAISLLLFQGKWRSVSLEDVRGKGQRSKIEWGIAAVRVKGDQWIYLNQDDSENARYRLAIDGSRKPATIDFHTEGANARQGKPSMLG